MIGINKIKYALFALSLSAGVMATAEASYNHAGRGYARCGGWYASVEPFYVRDNDSFFSKLSYADTNIFDSTDGDSFRDLRFYKIDPEEFWGFRVAIGYDFPSCDPCTQYGVSLEYTHFDDDEDDRTPLFIDDISGFQDDVVRPLFSGISNPDFRYAQARASLDTRYDAVDLLAHKNIYFGTCNASRAQLFVGARYVNFREEFRSDFRITAPLAGMLVRRQILETTEIERIHFDDRFDGIGPRIGGNVFYSLGGCFGVVGELAGEIVYGQSSSDYSDVREIDFAGSNTQLITLRDHHDNTAQFVPGLSGKVGLAFSTTFCNCSSLSIEIGYRGDKYFDLVDTSALVEGVTEGQRNINNNPAVFTGEKFNQDALFHDFSFSGPYLSVTFHA